MRTFLRYLLVALAGGGVLSLSAYAHDGPEHEIDELTEQMKVQGQTPDLLIQRAIEYKIIGKLAEAAKDLERALDFDAESLPAQRELSQTYFSLGKTNEALTTVTRALRASTDTPDRAALLMVRVEILRARRDFTKALSDANEAIAKYPSNVEWYLIRSQLQALLKLRPERVSGIEAGMRETGSGLLLAEWVDALIDNQQYAAALEKIEVELNESRWRAAWLIRRAKVRQATEHGADAKVDLNAAIEELNSRISSSNTDALLLADRALAYDLLGKRDDARRDFRAARDKGLTDEWVRDRIRALREPGKDED